MLSLLRRMATFRRSGILGSSPAAPQKAFPRREPPRCKGSRLLAKHHKYMGKTVVIMSFLSESRKSAPQPLSSPVLFSLHTPAPKDPVLVVKGCGLKLSEAPHPSAARPAPRAPPQDGRGGGWAAPSHPPGSSGTRSPTPSLPLRAADGNVANAPLSTPFPHPHHLALPSSPVRDCRFVWR